MSYGTIHVTQTIDGFNQKHLSFKFEGDIFCVDAYLLQGKDIRAIRKGSKIVIDGTLLICMSANENFTFVFGKASSPMTYLHMLLAPIVATVKLVYRRIILTLCVWNLGQAVAGGIPSYKWIVNRWKK